MGNPFLEESSDLLALHSKDIASSAVVETVRKIEEIGGTHYDQYVELRLRKATLAISDPIPKQKLALFSRQHDKVRSRSQLHVADLEVDRELMSKLYISCQNRAVNMGDFFMHGNHPYPPSISDHAKLHACTKSDLVECLVSSITPATEAPTVDTIVLDGAAVVHILEPRTVTTFSEYASSVFIPYIDRQLLNAQRVDVVWDRYVNDSLKESTRSRRGKGVRRRVLGTSKSPRNWREFLSVAENKVELFDLLTHAVVDRQQAGVEVYATDGENVLCSHPCADCTSISPCNHEEADTRLLVHVNDAAKKGSQRCLIRTVDTDVLVLAIAYVNKIDIEELWVAFGTGKTFRYIPAHEIACSLGNIMASALPVFHAFTGCDTVSAFVGRGKKTVWAVWHVFPEITEAFIELSRCTRTISADILAMLERFVILMYDRTSDLTDINVARKELFTRKGRFRHANESSTVEHAKRATIKAAMYGAMEMCSKMMLPDPEEWGWSKTDTGWEPCWTKLPEASKACRELIKCSCRKGCTKGRCGCSRAKLPCTTLCSCMCMENT